LRQNAFFDFLVAENRRRKASNQILHYRLLVGDFEKLSDLIITELGLVAFDPIALLL